MADLRCTVTDRVGSIVASGQLWSVANDGYSEVDWLPSRFERSSMSENQQMSIESQEREFLKTVAAFFLVAPLLYAPFHAILSIGAGYAYEGRFELLESALLIWSSFLGITFLYFLGLLMGSTWMLVYFPTLLTGAAFWAVATYLRRRASGWGRWEFRLSCALVATLVSVVFFVVFDPSFTANKWAELYFYRTRESGHADMVSEWGFLDAFGPLFHLVSVCLTGFSLGFVFAPKQAGLP